MYTPGLKLVIIIAFNIVLRVVFDSIQTISQQTCALYEQLEHQQDVHHPVLVEHVRLIHGGGLAELYKCFHWIPIML